MPQRVAVEQRLAQRVAVALTVQLGRKVGSDVVARTEDLGVGGASVVSGRPLRVDEELRFDLDLPVGGRHLTGTARVLRQHRHDRYALRFEHIDPDGIGILGANRPPRASAEDPRRHEPPTPLTLLAADEPRPAPRPTPRTERHKRPHDARPHARPPAYPRRHQPTSSL